MANEVLFADLSGSARLAAVLHQEIVLKLADRASLHMHPAILRLGNVQGRGSSTVQIPVVGLDGHDIMSSVADGSAVSNTALSESGVNVTVARHALQYSISDLANLTDSVGLNVARRSLGLPTIQLLENLVQQSMAWALAHPEEAMDFASRFGRGPASRVREDFVAKFANSDTLLMPPDVRLGLSALYTKAQRRGFIARLPRLDIVDPQPPRAAA